MYSSEDDTDAIVGKARSLKLEIQSLHAPFTKAADLWCDDTERRECAVEEQISALDFCRRQNIPVMVAHVWIGMGTEASVTLEGLDSFDRIVRAAEERGVKIAFENTEGEEYLNCLMDRYRDSDTVGFCWDSGHEMCYNGGCDLLARYGDRLLVTHLNDNLGVRSYSGEITWLDDLHLLPYDGIIDWDSSIERLRRSKHLEILNLELTTVSKPGCHDNDKYGNMGYEAYFAEAYARACRIAYRYSK